MAVLLDLCALSVSRHLGSSQSTNQSNRDGVLICIQHPCPRQPCPCWRGGLLWRWSRPWLHSVTSKNLPQVIGSQVNVHNTESRAKRGGIGSKSIDPEDQCRGEFRRLVKGEWSFRSTGLQMFWILCLLVKNKNLRYTSEKPAFVHANV